MTKNILITGGTGFIGSNLIKSLNKEYRCINIGRGKSAFCENIYWDLKERLICNNNIDIDTVIHSASIVGEVKITKSDYIDINVKSTLELLEYCVKNNVKKFIYISTGGVYGHHEKTLNEDNQCNPLDIYSASKYFSEKLCDLYKDKISIVILRLFFPYGNGQRGRLFSNLVENIVNNKEITLNKGGLPIINPIHVFDVVNILKKVIEIECNGIFNVCGNEHISLQGLCEKIALHANIKKLNIVYRDNNVDNLAGSNEKVFKLLNYKASIDLDTGIDMYLNNITFIEN